MALKSPPLLPCPFFKTSEDHRRGQARAFYGLISQGRFDLIRKYIEPYRDAGFLDGEIEQAEERRAELNMFAVENLMELRGYYAMNPFVESSQSQESDENEDDGDGLDDMLENYSEDIVDVGEGGIAEEHEPEEADEVFPGDMDEHGLLELEGLSQNASDEATDENSIGDVDETEGVYGSEMYTNEDIQLTEGGDTPSTEDEPVDPVEGKTVRLLRSLLPMPKARRINWCFERSYGMFAAEIVYKATEEYTLILRKLWSGKYKGAELENLVISKWEAECFFGSHLYWQLTNLSPERIMDQCERNAARDAREAIVRKNRRLIAGVDSVYDERFIERWHEEQMKQRKNQRLKLPLAEDIDRNTDAEKTTKAAKATDATEAAGSTAGEKINDILQ